MADRQTAIKSIVAAMESIGKIQEQQNKLRMNLLENSQKYQDWYLQKAMGNKMDIQKEQELGPIKLEQKKAEAGVMSPLEQEQYNQYKANPQGFDISGGKPKPLGLKDMAERVYMKPEKDWTDSDRATVNRYIAYSGLGKEGQKIIGQDFEGKPIYGAAEKGLPIETGGKLAMVQQAKKDIGEVRQMLFPDGTAKSFRRDRAIASNLPGSRAFGIGAIIPQALPDVPIAGKGYRKAAQVGQDIYSRLQNAVAAKLRVETGAQANPSEVENILRRFGITGATSPESAFSALKRLEEFMDSTIRITDPSGKFSEQPKQKYSIGEIITGPNNKTYRVTGGDMNDPDVEEVIQ